MMLAAPLLVGSLMIGVVAVLQALAIGIVVRLVRPDLAREDPPDDLLHDVGLFLRALLVMVAAQLAQIGAWASLFYGLGEFRDFPTAYYHSAVNFTTLGYGDIVMSPRWRLLGPLEAIAGMLMFGISTAGLFGVALALIRRHEGTWIR